jgi:hypothetical protein
VDFAPNRFDTAPPDAEHRHMERLDHTRTFAAALVHLGDACGESADHAGADHTVLSRKVDKLVDAHLVSFNTSAKQTLAMRKILADEFLNLAPFTELSYRIWRRIMREDTDAPEPPLRVASECLLPDLDFPPPAPFIPQRAVAVLPSRPAAKASRSFFRRRA